MCILQSFCAFVKDKKNCFYNTVEFLYLRGKNVMLFLACITMAECNSPKWLKYYF